MSLPGPIGPRRSRASAKAAGTRFETAVASWLARNVDDRIERRARTGAKDRGDISGVRHMGVRVVIECKDTTRLAIGDWLREAEIERGNDDALVAVVVAKRRGLRDPGEALVLMTLVDLAALLTGARASAA